MNSQLRVGIIGLDTSHVAGLANFLNEPQHEDFMPGARITMGYPGGSPDFKKSALRVEGYTQKLHQFLQTLPLDEATINRIYFQNAERIIPAP